MHPAKHIVLIGPMGVGKTSVGRALARKLGIELIDTDSYLEETIAPISWIMDKEGEAGFRVYESRCLREIFTRFGAKPLIVATGGGIVLQEKNRQFFMAQNNITVVYLQASAALLANRSLHTRSRPALAAANDKLAFFTAMLAKRQPLFTQVADVTFDVADYTNLQALVHAILVQLG